MAKRRKKVMAKSKELEPWEREEPEAEDVEHEEPEDIEAEPAEAEPKVVETEPKERTWARTEHDDLLMPDGRKFGETEHVGPLLVKLEIPGASVHQGRQENGAYYSAYLYEIYSQAGQAAMKEWLDDHASYKAE